MRKKIIIGLVILAIIGLIIFICCNVGIETEYTPEEEIGDTEYRNTVVSLYFQNKENKELQVEARLIDSKELLDNPYSKLINLLLAGTSLDTLESAIPQNTKLIGTVLENDCLIVNLSNDFLDIAEDDMQARNNAIYAIVNTITQLKEVSSVKFLIDGKEIENMKNPYVRKD